MIAPAIFTTHLRHERPRREAVTGCDRGTISSGSRRTLESCARTSTRSSGSRSVVVLLTYERRASRKRSDEATRRGIASRQRREPLLGRLSQSAAGSRSPSAARTKRARGVPSFRYFCGGNFRPACGGPLLSEISPPSPSTWTALQRRSLARRVLNQDWAFTRRLSWGLCRESLKITSTRIVYARRSRYTMYMHSLLLCGQCKLW